jgi:hypothetical protein
MKMPGRRKWLLLGIGMLVLLAWAGSYRDTDEISLPLAKAASAVKPKTQVRRSLDVTALDLTARQVETGAGETANLFAGKSWYVAPPPPPAAKPLPAPPPTAPPLPFTYLGRYQDAATPIIYLVRGERVLLVRAGDVIEGTYRVDGIAGSRLGLTYLPLNIGQTLDIGNAE